MKVAQTVEEAIRPLFENLDVKLVEVEYVKKVDGMHLVVLLDKEGGVTLEDCQIVARLVDPILEELNPTNDASYYFDVSSYGLDRPLKFDWQFDNYKDKELDVKLYMKVEGLKDFTGILKDYTDTTMTFEVNGKEIELDRKQIATLLPHIEF